MKQIVQNLRTGVLELMEVPCPQAARGHLLVQTRASLISAGTERSLVEFGKANLLTKARQNPERVKQVMDQDQGRWTAANSGSRLQSLGRTAATGLLQCRRRRRRRDPVSPSLPLGIESPATATMPKSSTSRRICAPRFPREVSDEEASFAVLGSIALQGIRLLQPQLGETVVVFGLGLVGLMAVQMLVAVGHARDWHRSRSAAASDGRIVWSSDDQSRRRRRSRHGGPGTDTRTRCRRCADHGQCQARHDCEPVGANDAQTRTFDPGGRRQPGTESRRILRKRTHISGVLLVRTRSLRPGIRTTGTSTIRTPSCVGPSSETSRRCWSLIERRQLNVDELDVTSDSLRGSVTGLRAAVQWQVAIRRRADVSGSRRSRSRTDGVAGVRSNFTHRLLRAVRSWG